MSIKTKILAISLLVAFSNNAFSQNISVNKIKGLNLIESHLRQKTLVDFLYWYALDDKMKTSFFETVVGKMYYQGKILNQNEQEAFKLFQVAAENGFKEAQFNLAVMYEEGRIVEQNYDEAIKWYTSAAQQGHLNAQFHVGLAYIKKQQKDKSQINDEELIKWWSLAANQGHPEAKYWLNVIEKSASNEFL